MRIASITRTVPYDGIPHAGGDYALRHARALLELGHEVTLIAPNTEENRRAVGHGGHGGSVVLYGDPTIEQAGSFERLRRRLSPARVSRSERRALSRCAPAHAAFAVADIVEYQWTQAGDLHRVVRRSAPAGVGRLLVLHDVMTQQVQRQRDSGGGGLAAWLTRSLKLVLVRRAERRALAAVDVAVVFSEKDAAAAHSISPGSTDVRVLRPPLAAGIQDVASNRLRVDDTSSFEVLYVGWFRRDDNARAAEWMCQEVWPTVRSACPQARLTLAGADPTAAMTAAARRDPTVTVTGYRESLDEFYARADVAAIPVRQGAGVKFKTVLAMLWGVPVVSTSVGLEGITQDPALIWRQAEDATDFAAGIIAAAAEPGTAARVAQAARRWAQVEFSDATFRRDLADLVDRVGVAPRP